MITNKLTPEEVSDFMEPLKVTNQLPQKLLKKLHEFGWKIIDDYAIEKEYKGYYIIIEFCIGDYCVYPCSKNEKWLLESKKQGEDFMDALILATKLENRIDNGEHWQGEED